MAESRQGRLVRWRFDLMIAGTASVTALPLVHNDPQDFEVIRAAIETSSSVCRASQSSVRTPSAIATA